MFESASSKFKKSKKKRITQKKTKTHLVPKLYLKFIVFTIESIQILENKIQRNPETFETV